MEREKPEEFPPDAFLPDDVCCCLRTKTMSLNTDYRRSPFEGTFTADTALFHCLKTMDAHGPDEEDVEPELCRPGRGCWCSMVDPT